MTNSRTLQVNIKYQIISKETITDYDMYNACYDMLIKLEIKTILNPAPEDIFSIV